MCTELPGQTLAIVSPTGNSFLKLPDLLLLHTGPISPVCLCYWEAPDVLLALMQDILVPSKEQGFLPSLQEGTRGFLKLSKPRKSREGIRFQAETNTQRSLERSDHRVLRAVLGR